MIVFTKDDTAGKLRGLRATARLTQKQLSDLSGVSEASIKGYESGQNTMSLEVAVKLSAALNATPNDLVSII